VTVETSATTPTHSTDQPVRSTSPSSSSQYPNSQLTELGECRRDGIPAASKSPLLLCPFILECVPSLPLPSDSNFVPDSPPVQM